MFLPFVKLFLLLSCSFCFFLLLLLKNHNLFDFYQDSAFLFLQSDLLVQYKLYCVIGQLEELVVVVTDKQIQSCICLLAFIGATAVLVP